MICCDLPDNAILAEGLLPMLDNLRTFYEVFVNETGLPHDVQRGRPVRLCYLRRPR